MLGRRQPHTAARLLGHRPTALASLLASTLLVGVAAGCSSGDGPPGETSGWRRTEVRRHHDVAGAYDRVAVEGHPGGVAWLTWDTGAADALAYWELDDDQRSHATTLRMPDDPVLIPVDVATDREGWLAVAVTRDRPNGENTGLVAWRSRSRSDPRPVRLEVSGPGLDVPERVSAGRLRGISVVAGVVDGSVVTWIHDGDDGDEGDDRGWRPTLPDLRFPGDLVTADLASDGERFLLAGVDTDGDAHLWTSTDTRTWEPITGDAMPSDTGSVTVLGPLGRGEVAIAWVAAGGDDAPRSGPGVTIQRLAGGEVAGEGTIEADPDAGTIEVSAAGATRSPEGNLVVVGAAWRRAGERAPMVWVRDGDRWEPTDQPELVGRVDHELRTVTTTSDTAMHAVVTPFPSHVDVEVWEWHADG